MNIFTHVNPIKSDSITNRMIFFNTEKQYFKRAYKYKCNDAKHSIKNKKRRNRKIDTKNVIQKCKEAKYKNGSHMLD